MRICLDCLNPTSHRKLCLNGHNAALLLSSSVRCSLCVHHRHGCIYLFLQLLAGYLMNCNQSYKVDSLGYPHNFSDVSSGHLWHANASNSHQLKHWQARLQFSNWLSVVSIWEQWLACHLNDHTNRRNCKEWMHIFQTVCCKLEWHHLRIHKLDICQLDQTYMRKLPSLNHLASFCEWIDAYLPSCCAPSIT